MADLFDILGRRIEGSLEEISDAFAKASTKVTDTAKEQATQVGALGEMIKRLDKIIKDTESRDTKVKNRAASVGKVKLDPKDADLFRRAAEAFDRANSNRREEKVDLAPTERALNSIKGGIDKLIQVAESKDFVSAAERMMSKLASQTLSVQDKGLTTVAEKILGHLENSGRPSTRAGKQTTVKDKKNLKGDSGFNAELRKLVKAGLSKGSIYTHDFGTQSLLTEIMNDGKIAIAALRIIANKVTGGTIPRGDTDKLQNADLRNRKLSTLSKSSIVTDNIAKAFQRRRGGSTAAGTAAGATSGNPQANPSANPGIPTDNAKDLARSISYDKRSIGASKTFLESLNVDLAMAAKVVRNKWLLEEEETKELEHLINKLKVAESLGDQALAKQIIDDINRFDDAISRGVHRLDEVDGRLHKFVNNLDKVGKVFGKIGSLASSISPTSYGLMPSPNYSDPGQLLAEAGQSFAAFNKDLVGATFAGFGAKGDPFAGAKGGADKLNIALAETGMNIRDAYVQTGALAEEFRGAYLKNIRRGITEFTTLNRVTKLGLSLGTAIGANAESTAEEFADWNQYLGATADQLDTIGRRTVQIGRATGVTGDNLVNAVKAARVLANEMRNAGTFTSEASANLIELSANAKKLGIDDQVNRLAKGLLSANGFFNDIDDKTRGLLAQAAGRTGRLGDLQRGTILNNKQGYKDLATGLEDVFRQVSGGFGTADIGKMNADQLAALNMRLQAAFGMQSGEFQKLIQAYRESGMSAEDRLAEIEKKLSGTLSTKDREMLMAQKEQTKALAAKEKFDAKIAKGEGLKEKLNALRPEDFAGQRQVIESQLGGAAGVKDYLNSLSEELKKSSGFDTAKIDKKFGNTKDPAIKAALDDAKKQKVSAEEAMAKAAARLDELARNGITSGEEFANAIEEAKAAQGGLADVQGLFNETSLLKKAEFEQNKLNLDVMQKVQKGLNSLTQAMGLNGMFIVANTAAIGLLTATMATNLIGKLGDLKDLKDMFGKGFRRLRAGRGAGATTAGVGTTGTTAAAGTASTAARGGLFGRMFGGIGRAASSLGKSVGGLGKTLGVAGKLVGKVGGKIFAPLAGIIGGITGFMESGSIGGTLMGVLTGDSKTGSFLSEYLGLEKGGMADKALGVGGAAVHGAGLGAGIGLLLAPFTGGASVPIAAAIGAVVGGLTELFKIFMESSIGKKIIELKNKILDFFTGKLWQAILRIKKSFEPLAEKIGALWDKISERAGKFVDKLQGKLWPFLEKFGERFQKGIERIAGWIEDGITKAMPYIEWFFDVGIEMVGQAFDHLANTIGFVVDAIDTGIFAFDLFTAQLKDTFTTVSSIPGMLMGKMMTTIYDNATAAGRKILDAAGFTPNKTSSPPAESEVEKVMRERQKEQEKSINKMTPKAPGPNATTGGGFETQMMNDAKRRMVDDIAIRIGPKIPKGVSPATHYQLAEKIATELKKPGYSDGEFKSASETVFKKYLPEALKKPTVAEPATPPTPKAEGNAGAIMPPPETAKTSPAEATPSVGSQITSAITAPAKAAWDVFTWPARTIGDQVAKMMPTAPTGNVVENAANQVRTNQAVSDNELRAIEEGNTRLATVERNTQQTANEVSRLADIMERLMSSMVGKPDRVAPMGAESRIPKAAPTNYYQANMSPQSLPGMGGIVPN